MTTLSDAELLDWVRQGDEAAFSELYARHRDVACRMATSFCRRNDVDDVVDLAFEKVLGALRRGRGPTGAFRAYLFVTLRRLAADDSLHLKEQSLDDVPEVIVSVANEPALEANERDMITAAFETLPDRWQAVLWHTAVEGRHPRELADTLGLSANAVSALAYRAREKLRQAYLQAHLQAAPRRQCEPHRSLLGAYVRGGLSRREHAVTEAHVESCMSCQALIDELGDVNRLLARAILPIFLIPGLGKIGAGLSLGSATTAAAAEVAEGGVRALKHWLLAASKPTQVGTVVGGLAASTALVVGLVELKPHVLPSVQPSTDTSAHVEDTESNAMVASPELSEAIRTGAAEPVVCADGSVAPGSTPTTQQLANTSTTAVTELVDNVLGLVSPNSSVNVTAPTGLLTNVSCTPGEPGYGDLTVAVGPTEPTDDMAAEGLVPVDAQLTIDLTDGARIALDVGLPAGCEVSDDRQSITCLLEDIAPGLPTEARIALEAVAQEDAVGATITVRDGEETILSQTVDLTPVLGVLGVGSDPQGEGEGDPADDTTSTSPSTSTTGPTPPTTDKPLLDLGGDD